MSASRAEPARKPVLVQRTHAGPADWDCSNPTAAGHLLHEARQDVLDRWRIYEAYARPAGANKAPSNESPAPDLTAR